MEGLIGTDRGSEACCVALNQVGLRRFADQIFPDIGLTEMNNEESPDLDEKTRGTF